MRKIWMIVWAVAWGLAAAQASHASELECRSSGYRYQFCSADTGNNVQLLRQYSSAPCDQGRSWGYDSRGIWVDNGCAGAFRYGREQTSHGSGNAVAVLAGALVVAAIIGSQTQHQSHDHNTAPADPNVAGWAVGRFAGEDFETGLGIELAIDRNGRIDGYQGSREFYGQLRGSQAWIGNREYSVVQTRSGIRFIGEGRSGFDLRRN